MERCSLKRYAAVNRKKCQFCEAQRRYVLEYCCSCYLVLLRFCVKCLESGNEITLTPCGCSSEEKILNLRSICTYLGNKKEGERLQRLGELVLTREVYSEEELKGVEVHKIQSDL